MPVLIALLWTLPLLSAEAPASRPGEAAFRELYKELVEINTTLSSGSCTAAAGRAPERVIDRAVVQQDPVRRQDMTGQLRRGVVQDYDVALAPNSSAEEPDAAQADVEAVGGAWVHRAVEQNAHVDVAFPVRATLGDAAEQIRGDDASNLLPERVGQRAANRAGASVHTPILEGFNRRIGIPSGFQYPRANRRASRTSTIRAAGSVATTPPNRSFDTVCR